MTELFSYPNAPGSRDRDTSRDEWRVVPGFPAYEVNSSALIRNVATGKRIRPWRLKNGRWQVHLRRAGKRKAFHTYRLVALAFLGPPPFVGAEVAHEDDDLDPNHLRNLRWSDHLSNCADRSRNGGTATGDRNGARRHPERLARGERAGASRLNTAAVLIIRSTAGRTTELARRFAVTTATIKHVRQGKTWRHIAAVQPARLNRP